MGINTKIILPVDSFTLPAGLILSGRNIQYKFVDPVGNQIALLSRLTDYNAALTNAMPFQQDLVTGLYMPCINIKQADKIKFGPAKCSYLTGLISAIRLPLGSLMQNAQGFVYEFTCKFGVSSGTNLVILNDLLAVTGVERWKFIQYNLTSLRLVTYNLAGIPFTFTAPVTLDTTNVWRIRFGYDGSGADGTCNAFISTAIDGAAFTKVTNSSCKKIPTLSPLYGVGPGVQVGFDWTDDPTTGMHQGGDSNSSLYMEELIGYNSYIAALGDGTPATSILLPFVTTNPEAYIDLDAGRSDFIWNPALLSAVDLTNWTAGNLKVRAVYSATASPALTGTPVTLASFQGGAKKRARYCRLGVTWQGTNGVTQIACPDMYYGGEPGGFF